MTRTTSKIRTIRALASVMPLQQTRRFGKDEDGAVVAFTLFVLVMMLIAGGVAVDVMRHEMERARLQNTLDTAVLAAAGAPFGTSPKGIVQDYFAKADMSSYLDDIDDDGEGGDDDITQTLNTSKVKASANMTMDTHLMKLAGVKSLTALAASSAERRVPKLEVAMVLDVSGSMDDNSKLTNLKTAAKSFVTTILNSAAPGDAVISIVPFSWDVSAGENILNQLDVDKRQNYSTCLQFKDNDFKSAAINPQVEQLQLIYTSEYDYGLDSLNSEYRTCYNEPNAEILPYSISETKLHAKIMSLEARGNTSGNMGIKWGAALLDPNFQSVKTGLSAIKDEDDNPLVSDLIGTVPANYNEAETLKVIVMMGDGQNTYSNQFPENSSFRGDNSYLHKVEWEDSVFDYAYRTYNSSKTSDKESRCGQKNWECVYRSVIYSSYFLYNPNNGKYKNLSNNEYLNSSEFDDLKSAANATGYENYSWEMAWGRMSPDFLDKKIYYDDAEDEFEDSGNRVQGWEKDDQMQDVCSAAKKNDKVVVYTIGFEVDKDGTAETELKKCATTFAHYYPAKGINITAAFSSIASNVVNLRLTQ